MPENNQNPRNNPAGSNAKLNQIIAIEKGVKAQGYSAISELNKAIQKPDLFNGFTKLYQPVEENGEVLPHESKKVQFNVKDILAATQKSMTDLMDITSRKDWTNCSAKAAITVDGRDILENVPVTYLLFLEKQLTDLRTFVDNLPVLDYAETWESDENSGLYRSREIQTHRTKKIQKAIVLYDATPVHPAQTQLITEDVLAGHWKQTKYSGAISKPNKEILAEKVEKLLRAVKQAREEANSVQEVSTPEIGEALFSYLMK